MDNNIQEGKSALEMVEISCMNPIKNRFDLLLKHNKLRQTDLANLLSVDKAYICRIVNGKENPPLIMKLKIAEVLKTDTGVIWGDYTRRLEK